MLEIPNKSKFKIAVQLFGHLRTYKECYQSLKEHLLDKYDCDVFMHTWDTIDHSTQTWHSIHMENKNDNTSQLRSELEEIYNLKKIKIEHQEPKDTGLITAIASKISVYGMQCMFHSMTVVNSLREDYQQETGTQYDFVITLRPDLLLSEDFNIEYYLERMSEDEIGKAFFTYFFPMIGIWNDYKKIGASDIFYFAKPDIITNIFKHIETVVEKIKPDIKINFGPEVYFLELIQTLGYDIKLIKYNYNTEYIIKRPTSNKKEINKKTKKNFRLKISLKEFYLYLFANLSFNIIDLRLNLFNFFKLTICVGGNNDK